MQQEGADAAATKVILGGPMMGMAVASLDVPITKGASGVVVYAAEDPDQHDRKVYPCIKCPHCVEACPMSLNPSMMALLAIPVPQDSRATIRARPSSMKRSERWRVRAIRRGMRSK